MATNKHGDHKMKMSTKELFLVLTLAAIAIVTAWNTYRLEALNRRLRETTKHFNYRVNNEVSFWYRSVEQIKSLEMIDEIENDLREMRWLSRELHKSFEELKESQSQSADAVE